MVFFLIVYPQLNSLLDKLIVNGIFAAVACWLVTNVLTSYAVNFDSASMGTVCAIVQAVFLVLIVFLIFRWMRAVAAKQKTSFIQFNRLTTDEYAVLSYIVPLTLSPIAQLLYSFSSREISWQNRSQTGLLVHMAIIYTLHMILVRKFTLFISTNHCIIGLKLPLLI